MFLCANVILPGPVRWAGLPDESLLGHRAQHDLQRDHDRDVFRSLQGHVRELLFDGDGCCAGDWVPSEDIFFRAGSGASSRSWV